jgi:hypothetical protein
MEASDTLDRVRSAIAGQLDPAMLTGEERRYYYRLLDAEMANPSPDEVSAMARLGSEPGAVGYDDSDHLVRSRQGGGVDVIEE